MQKLGFVLLGLFILASCSRQIHLSNAEVTGYELTGDQHDPATDIEEMIAPYKSQLDAKMNEVVGEITTTLTKGKPESTLGNWVSDAIYEITNQNIEVPVDFALQNYGGIRVGSIAKGPLTVRKIYELMPFDNLVTVMEVEGRYIDSLLVRYARTGGAPISSTLRFEIEDGQPVNATIHGEPVDVNKKYRFALPDYVAGGGDRMSFLKELERTDLDLYIRDALIDFARQTNAKKMPISAVIDGRIQINGDENQ